MLEELGKHLQTLPRETKPIIDINSNMGYPSTDRWKELARVIKTYYRDRSVVQAGLDGIDNDSRRKI